jgi:tRNA-modifying protein YgfZ
MHHPLNGAAPLPHLGVIRAEGEEAAKFLHGQLTHDFALLGNDRARLAAFCTPKGRMLASFIGMKRPAGDILLVCSRDVLAATLKRLSMFVLRAKCKLSDATAQFQLLGLAGDAVPGDVLTLAPWEKKDSGPASIVRLYPADGQPRALWIAPSGEPAPQAGLSEELWRWGEVRSGVATLSAPVAEAFVPQMLNYESVDGVSFKKGCYPGQEVVARSQFRGTLKRRAFLVHCDAPLAAGAEVFHTSDAEQPTGLVVQAAQAPAGGWDAVVSMQTGSAEGGGLSVGAADGPALSLLPLPYLLLDDV